MRLRWLACALAALAAAAITADAGADEPAAGEKPPNPDDILGNIVVVAGAGRPLPKVAVYPSLASEIEDVTLRSVVSRDLDLCGEFEVLPDAQAPQGLYLDDSPIDVAAWRGKGVEALVRVRGKKVNDKQALLRGQAYLLKHGPDAVYDKKFIVPEADLRNESHRLADLLIGALTGQNGGFASHMTFASGSGGLRRIFTIDADGHDAKAVSSPGVTAIAPAFGKNGELFFAISKNEEPYRLVGPQGPVAVSAPGSVYGLAFSRDKSKVALSIGVGNTIHVFEGPDFAHVTQASPIGMALHPSFTPSGKLGFVGEGKFGQRVYVDTKPISPDGLYASSPTFCNNPDGVRAIFAVGVGKNTDLVSTGETGGGLARLTQNQGRNGYPACSPDGRLVAFFTTRTSNQGPGLYIMRVDGGRPKRISNLLGDSLRWEALPPGNAVEAKN
ncbi:MAG TPA: tolB protein [Minicystis sp.]|nr:tolB protein [Minicystis sp.]